MKKTLLKTAALLVAHVGCAQVSSASDVTGDAERVQPSLEACSGRSSWGHVRILRFAQNDTLVIVILSEAKNPHVA